MTRWPFAALILMLTGTAPQARSLPEVAAMRGLGPGCAAPFLMQAAAARARRVMAEEPPPWRRAMLTCVVEAGNPKRPLRRT